MEPSRRKLLLLLFVIAVAIAAVWFLTPRKPPQSVADFPRLAPGVVMRDVTFRSQALHRDMQYRVFLPQKPGTEKLAVVYLLHGGDGTFRDWSNYSNVARFAAGDLILVMPQGDYSYYTNAAMRPQDRYEDYIVNDLPADVEARADRDGRAIVGVSMGGFGAINLALRHPERYAFAGSLSAAIDAPRRAFTVRRLDQSRHFREIFGPDGSDSRRSNDPFVLARTTGPAAAPYLYLTCGRQEGLLAPNREFTALLTKYTISHEFHEVAGGHEWNQWDAQLIGLFGALRQYLVVNKQ